MSRYFRVNRNHLSAIARYTSNVSRYRQPTPSQRAALARELDVADNHWHDSQTYGDDTPTVRHIIEEALEPDMNGGEPRWGLSEEILFNLNDDAGAGWYALTVGEDRDPAAVRGYHIDELSDYQRHYVETAARHAGIDLYEPA